MATAILPEITKRIAYNREGRGYDCFIAIDGEQEQYIGSAANYSAAEKLCNDFAFHYYEDNHTPEKAAQVVLAVEETAEDIAADMADYAKEVRLFCLDLDPFDTIFIDKADDLNLYLDGTGFFAVDEKPGQFHTFTRAQAAAIYQFFQERHVQQRMARILRATLIEAGQSKLITLFDAAVAAPAPPDPAIRVKQ